jgi:hypothetical protein
MLSKYQDNFTISVYILLILASTGCSTFSGTPQSPLEFKPHTGAIESEEDLLNKYAENLAKAAIENPSNENSRNDLLSQAQTIIDIRYSQFINGTESERKGKEFISDFVELSMNLAGAAVGSAGTKTILAAISAGVNGINGSIDKTYFYEKTFPSLVAQMNADRKVALLRIEKGKGESLSAYSWSQATYDLIDYYNAGTLFSATSSIQKDAGKKESKADDEIIKIIDERVSFDTVKSNRDIITALSKINASNFGNIDFNGISKDLADYKSCTIATPVNATSAQTALQACIIDATPIGASDKIISHNLAIFNKYFKQAGIL